MDCAERIKTLLKERNISFRKVEIDLDFSNGYIRSLKGNKINAERLSQIADYLDVSSAYLMNGEDEKNYPSDFGEVDKELFDMMVKYRERPEIRILFNEMDNTSKDQALEIIDMIQQYKHGKK